MRLNILVLFFFGPTVFTFSIFGQNYEAYKELLTHNKNNLFPKVLIYDGPQLPLSYKDYNRLGFDYISVYSLKDPLSVPNKYKYILWTGVASNDAKAKWFTEKSPFVDDIDTYAKRWDNRLSLYKNRYFGDSNDKIMIIILDIEAKKTNKQLVLLNSPEDSKLRATKESINLYKTKMESLYRYPLEFAKKEHNYFNKWSSYSDVPIERNWWDIPNLTWEEWTSNPYNLNYITHKIIRGKAYETEFSKKLDFYSVSTYFFYSQKHRDPNIAKQYLAYLLFQLEANQAWSQKPIYLYYSFRYQGSAEKGTLISEEMVRNSVIFSFMSGADGLILYDDLKQPTDDPKYHLLLKTLIESVSTLDEYRKYFTNGNISYFKPENARDLFTERKSIIRGIEKDGKLLLAAVDPFAQKNDIKEVVISYKQKKIIIPLKGREIYLKEIKL